MKKYDKYQDYVIKDGKLVGEFEQMYKDFDDPWEQSIRESYASEKAVWMALETIQCLGGNGYINDYATGRLLRDAKLYDIGAGTNEIRGMLIGREIFRKNS